MKPFVLLSFAASILLSCNIKSEDVLPTNLVPNVGNGEIISKEHMISFDEIKVVQSISAEVIKSDTEKVIISAPDDIMDDILVDNNNGRLLIHFKPGLQLSAHKVSAKIFTKDFTKLEATSSAKIEVKDRFTQDKTEVEVSSSAGISGNLEANDLDIEVSSSGSFSGKVWAVNLNAEATSSGKIKMEGKASDAELDVASSGAILAENVIAKNAEISASSSGRVNIAVSEKLSAKASSSGSIKVIQKGRLNVISQDSNSGGRISIQ